MSRLERAAYFCLIFLSLVAGGTLIRRQVSAKTVSAMPSKLFEKELVGTKLDVPEIQLSKDGLTAVLFISSECHFCDASMPFYKQLSLLAKARRTKHLPFVVISREPTDIIAQHLTSHQVSPDHIYQVPTSFTVLRGTPTLLFVDRGGFIRQAFFGQLKSSREKEVLDLFAGDAADACQASRECFARVDSKQETHSA